MAATAKSSKRVVSTAQYKTKLEALTAENKRLKQENARLEQELAQYLDQWETIDGPALNVIVHLAGGTGGTAAAIAKATSAHIQIVETSLQYLHKLRYVQANGSGKKPTYTLLPKGERYLRERGLRA